MPPMRFTDEETLGLSLGLVAARGLGSLRGDAGCGGSPGESRAGDAASGPWEYEVLLETGIEDAREQVPPVVASLEETEGGVLMRGTADDLGGPRACWRGCRARLP
jgi:hypothetical protein